MRMIAGVIGLFVVISICFSACVLRAGGVQNTLLERYASVQSVSAQPFQFSCRLTKGRLRYNFRATTRDGKVVTGYVCTSGRLSPFPDIVHEDRT